MSHPGIREYVQAYRLAQAKAANLLYREEGVTPEVERLQGEASEIYHNAAELFGEENLLAALTIRS